jgi:group I intron endonuclease
LAEFEFGSKIMEKESPVEENVVSSTPVMRAPSAKQMKQGGARNDKHKMWDQGSPCEARAGVALTDREARRHVLDLEVVEDNRLRGAIYKITSPSGRAYIGLTRQEIAKRMTKHRAPSMQGRCRLMSRAIDKYGWEAMKVEVLLSNVPLSLLGSEESRLIQEHNTLAPNGYNLQTGGQIGFSRSATSRAKQSKAVTASWKDPSVQAKRSGSISANWMEKSSDHRRNRNSNAIASMHTDASVAARFETFVGKRTKKYRELLELETKSAHQYMLACLNRDIRNGKEGGVQAKEAYLQVALSVGRTVE